MKPAPLPEWIQMLMEGPGDPGALAMIFPFAKAMIGCPHDSHYHAEGDPWIHTCMVAAELEAQDGFSDLPGDRATILRFAAWAHDNAKPETTIVEFCPVEQRERVRQPNHAARGAWKIWQSLLDAGVDPIFARDIGVLVFWHQRPTHMFDTPQTRRLQRIIQFGQECSSTTWSDLLRLCLADQTGRRLIGGAAPDHVELDMLKLILEEESAAHQLNLFEETWDFPTPQARRAYLTKPHETTNLYYEPHEPPTCTVHVMSGLPGSGKDTLIAREYGDLPMISLDELRIRKGLKPWETKDGLVREAIEMARVFLARKQDFVWNTTGLSRDNRRKICALADDYRAEAVIHSIDIPASVAIERNMRRPDPVPVAVINELARKREFPSFEEASRIISWDERLQPREIGRRPSDPSPGIEP